MKQFYQITLLKNIVNIILITKAILKIDLIGNYEI